MRMELLDSKFLSSTFFIRRIHCSIFVLLSAFLTAEKDQCEAEILNLSYNSKASFFAF